MPSFPRIKLFHTPLSVTHKRSASLAHKWYSLSQPLLFLCHMNLSAISVLAADCLSPCDCHLEIFFLSHWLPFASLISISLSLKSCNPLITVEGRTVPIVGGNQEELVLGFPGKHVDMILPPYLGCLANCRLGPQYIWVHKCSQIQ